MKRGHGKRSYCRGKLLAIFVFALSIPGASAQSGSAVESGPAAEAAVPPGLPKTVRRFHLEATGFDNVVSNDFGHWAGTGIGLSYQQPFTDW